MLKDEKLKIKQNKIKKMKNYKIDKIQKCGRSTRVN